MVAAELLKPEHPVHKHFIADCESRNVEPTKRQARKFLQRFPNYKTED